MEQELAKIIRSNNLRIPMWMYDNQALVFELTKAGLLIICSSQVLFTGSAFFSVLELFPRQTLSSESQIYAGLHLAVGILFVRQPSDNFNISCMVLV